MQRSLVTAIFLSLATAYSAGCTSTDLANSPSAGDAGADARDGASLPKDAAAILDGPGVANDVPVASGEGGGRYFGLDASDSAVASARDAIDSVALAVPDAMGNERSHPVDAVDGASVPASTGADSALVDSAHDAIDGAAAAVWDAAGRDTDHSADSLGVDDASVPALNGADSAPTDSSRDTIDGAAEFVWDAADGGMDHGADVLAVDGASLTSPAADSASADGVPDASDSGSGTTDVQAAATGGYDQLGSLSKTLFQSSGNGMDYDQFVWDDFTVPATTDVSAVHWRGGYLLPPTYPSGAIQAFDVSFWATVANQPDIGRGAISLQEGLSFAETSAGSVGGVALFDYVVTFPSPFHAEAGVRYWIEIGAYQPGVPGWGIAAGSGADGQHFESFVNYAGGTQYRAAAGDAAFALVPVP